MMCRGSDGSGYPAVNGYTRLQRVRRRVRRLPGNLARSCSVCGVVFAGSRIPEHLSEEMEWAR
jgi:hypothetical protein